MAGRIIYYASKKFSGDFSTETALFLHGLIDREYSEICVTVPTGYNASHLKNGNEQVRYASKKTYDLGVCEVASGSGNMLRYLCELYINKDGD